MTLFHGKLIVIEGLEGAGKSTAVGTVINELTQRGISTVTTREPGGTDIGEILRSVIKNPQYSDVLDDKSELLLLYAARIQLIEQVIKPALKKGIWVIADRFELSTLAYQGGGRGLDLEMIKRLSAFCLDGFKPDLTLYLDIAPETGMQRVRQRGAYDRIEQQSLDFFHRVHQTYINHIQQNPDIVTVDASQPLHTVQCAIKDSIIQFIER
ncbi:dTMP kinase [Legionella worsleiensis]|uniref:Thymidylate kinase n=1 Tax=Legionella worsleiensis TaxID=45076 RepID=A0A0W1AJ85_9GAMM|nr:dTMP kinase [Legionella worsleiensis]KTD81455.1 thymidylate kinase [Legionella worsleiensis]STY30175.1 thymidylate kinase [Legionella worsleiensis]